MRDGSLFHFAESSQAGPLKAVTSADRDLRVKAASPSVPWGERAARENQWKDQGLDKEESSCT